MGNQCACSREQMDEQRAKAKVQYDKAKEYSRVKYYEAKDVYGPSLKEKYEETKMKVQSYRPEKIHDDT